MKEDIKSFISEVISKDQEGNLAIEDVISASNLLKKEFGTIIGFRWVAENDCEVYLVEEENPGNQVFVAAFEDIENKDAFVIDATVEALTKFLDIYVQD